MKSGVSQSGSPPARPYTSSPAARRALVWLVTERVREGVTEATRLERLSMILCSIGLPQKPGKNIYGWRMARFSPGSGVFLHMHRTPCKANELVSLIFIKKSTGPSRHGKGCCDPLPYLLVSEKFKFAVLGSLENLQPLLCKDSGEDQPPFPLDPLCHQGKSFDQDS